MQSKFHYIIDKINTTNFVEYPFKFLYIEDIFTKEHFEIITNLRQIKTENYDSTNKMLDSLLKNYYTPVEFPGCITDIQKYKEWYINNKNISTPNHTYGLTEGFGLALRLTKYQSDFLQELLLFLNSDLFLTTIKEKFDRKEDVNVETAIHKYVSGYEISPHPDIRKKSLTYLININTYDNNQSNINTSLLKFKPEKQYISEYWKNSTNIDRCWVPWDWCETEYVHSRNNSMIMFAPSHDTLHAVKLQYDHCKAQRTQIYGNLWYKQKPKVKSITWRELPDE